MRMKSWVKGGLAVCITAMMALPLTGCVVNDEGGHPEGWTPVEVETVPEIAALVPEDIAADGVLSYGTNPPFPPMEFKNSAGEIIGSDVDLAYAVGKVLGLEAKPVEQEFPLILPSISAGTVEFGASGFTDSEERRKNYDFVDYLTAGIQWAQQPGGNVDPDNACGLTVAVQRGTVSDTDDVARRSEECVAQGKPEIHKLAYESSDTAANALVLGRVDVFSADAPITAYAAARADGRMEVIGDIFDAAYYGWAVKKGSDLAPALAQALQYLIETGKYEEIMGQWNLHDTLIEQSMINGEKVELPPAVASKVSKEK